MLHSSGSLASGSLWDVILEPSTGDNVKSRLSFRLNNTQYGSASIEDTGNSISMSTDYHVFKNNNFWNVLLQRTAGPSGSDILLTDTYTSHSYELFIGEQIQDRINVLSKVLKFTIQSK